MTYLGMEDQITLCPHGLDDDCEECEMEAEIDEAENRTVEVDNHDDM